MTSRHPTPYYAIFISDMLWHQKKTFRQPMLEFWNKRAMYWYTVTKILYHAKCELTKSLLNQVTFPQARTTNNELVQYPDKEEYYDLLIILVFRKPWTASWPWPVNKVTFWLWQFSCSHGGHNGIPILTPDDRKSKWPMSQAVSDLHPRSYAPACHVTHDSDCWFDMFLLIGCM